jgi:hypothetical protein
VLRNAEGKENGSFFNEILGVYSCIACGLHIRQERIE